MKLYKCFATAFEMVIHSKLRSWLTIIGIVIGVASVIMLTSIGSGLQASVNEQLSSLGANSITITPGYSKAGSSGGPSGESSALSQSDAILSRNDVQVLKGISDIDYIDTEISGKATVYYIGSSGDLTITGVDQSVWQFVTTSKTEAGRLLDPADQNVVVISHSLAKSFFDKEIGINKIVTINNQTFRVVGILQESSGFGGDNSLYMPIQAAYQVLTDKKTDQYSTLRVIAKNGADIDALVAKIENRLNIERHVIQQKDKDFTVTSSKQIQSQVSTITGLLTLFLGLIAGISLVVGAVGIANTMFTSVLEKTKEIGIMKAIGAKNKDILFIFLFNACIVGIVGGLLGIFFGVGLSYAVNLIGIGGFKTVINPYYIIIALVVSIAVGMIAGVIPAYQGSKLKPVDALRSE